jgi:alkylation response protein AidB-like acyl-CoA dehydrogenase
MSEEMTGKNASDVKVGGEMPKDFGFGSDEEMLRDLAKKLLDEEMPIEKMRRLVAADPKTTYEEGRRPGWDEGLWKQCVELGWTGLAIPEASGGVGFKMAGIVGLVEEVGRHALASPLIATLNATFVLREAATEQAAVWLERVAEGSSATLAITNQRGAWEHGSPSVVARPTAGGLSLSGNAYFVQDAFKAGFFVVYARREDGENEDSVLCIVRPDAAGLELSQDHIHDLTRDQATLRFDGVSVAEADIVCFSGCETLDRAWPAILTTIAADLCGSGEWQLQTTTEYAKTRKQFDRPIGFFQAVKHPLSNAMIAIDRARSLVYHAACCLDSGSEDALRIARMAKSAASDAGRFMSDRSVQLHGGIGFTWECDVHLYFKRSMHNQMLYGDSSHQRRALANMIVGPISEPASED